MRITILLLLPSFSLSSQFVAVVIKCGVDLETDVWVSKAIFVKSALIFEADEVFQETLSAFFQCMAWDCIRQ